MCEESVVIQANQIVYFFSLLDSFSRGEIFADYMKYSLLIDQISNKEIGSRLSKL